MQLLDSLPGLSHPRGKGPALAPISESDDDEEMEAFAANQKAAQLAKLVGARDKRAAGGAAAGRGKAAKSRRT
jgi:hypothetical protein